MLQPHSALWHYLWLGPHILQSGLAVLLWRRGLHKQFPVFFSYLVFEAIEEFALYGMDVLPLGSVRAWWLGFCFGLLVEGVLKLGAIRELFYSLIRPRQRIAKTGIRLIGGVAATLVLLAAVAAAYAPMDHPQYLLAYRAHILLQSFYIVEGGLVLSLFLFVAHFKLIWESRAFGIAIGFGILFCEHLAAWSVMATGAVRDSHFYLLDFLNMATYHLCLLIWCYYLLVPHKSAITSEISLPENNLAVWNRELERLLQQ